MDISIVICTYNRCESLRRVLDDLKHMKVPAGTSHEVIVVDNNSKDDTRVVVEAARQECPGVFNYVFESRQGKSFALNTSIRTARGEIVAFTDDDVFLDRDWLTEMKNVFDSCGCAGIGGKILAVWNTETPRWFANEGPYKLGGAIVELDLGDEICDLDRPAYGANMAFRRHIFEKYGLFREDLGPNPQNLIRNEDSEFCRRIIKGGEKFIYAPTVIVYHPVEENRTRKEYFEAWQFNYGRALVRINGIPSSATCYFGIPRYFFRNLLRASIRWALTIDAKRRFYYKLQAFEAAGQITECRTRNG